MDNIAIRRRNLALALAPGLMPLLLLAVAKPHLSAAAVPVAFDHPTPRQPAVMRASYIQWRRLTVKG